MTIAACPPPSVVQPGIVVFDFPEFIGIYPEFTTALSGAVQNNFNLATLLLKNCCGSVVFDPNIRQSLLYLLTAHITFLNTPCGANNNQPSGMVGRIDSAAEGSVVVGSEMPNQSGNAAWYNQTKYGAQFWAMTASVRSAFYTPPPQNCCGPLEGFGGGLGPTGTGVCGWNGGSA